jgi:hypothetical protein
MVRGGGWLWWAYRTYDICTLLSIQYLGVLGGTWGGSRSDYSRHLYILGCAGGGVQGYLFIPCTKTKKTRRLLSLSTKFVR